ncbi:MAG: hypothetical protein K8H86_00930 [Ignavibacteriaceae bacterium]|nr:hypothetical protein [Ignavibacteriaceae bacterium]
MSVFFIELRKDIYNYEYLSNIGLNERQIRTVLLAKEKEKVTNKEYQEINKISKRTATTELMGMCRLWWLKIEIDINFG